MMTDRQYWVTPQEFGALCDGKTDDGEALLAALSSGKPVRHTIGALALTSITVALTCDFEIASSASIVLLPTGNAAVGITFNGKNSTIIAYGLIDGNQTGRSPIALGDGKTSADHSTALLYNVQNVSGETWSGTHSEALLINGGTGIKFFVKGSNFPNNALATTSASLARLVTVQGYADQWVGACEGDQVWIGCVTAIKNGHLLYAKVTNAGEEAVYHLAGRLTVDEVHYSGYQQSVVNEADIYVGRIFHTGGNPTSGVSGPNGGAVIAVQNAGETSIGVIHVGINPDVPVGGPGTIATVRRGNVQSGPLRIGCIQGVIRPTGIFALAYNGSIQSATIHNVDIDVQYDPAVMTSINRLFDVTVAQQFDFRNWRVRVYDITGANPTGSGSYFQGQLPPIGTLLRDSVFEEINFYLYMQDGLSLMPYPGLRIRNGAQPLVHTNGQVWEPGIACIRDATAYGGAQPGVDIANTNPTTGTWVQGKRIMNAAPVEVGTAGSKYVLRGWTCTASGLPGTWLQDRALTGN
jgi:hypothetical protein